MTELTAIQMNGIANSVNAINKGMYVLIMQPDFWYNRYALREEWETVEGTEGLRPTPTAFGHIINDSLIPSNVLKGTYVAGALTQFAIDHVQPAAGHMLAYQLERLDRPYTYNHILGQAVRGDRQTIIGSPYRRILMLGTMLTMQLPAERLAISQAVRAKFPFLNDRYFLYNAFEKLGEKEIIVTNKEKTEKGRKSHLYAATKDTVLPEKFRYPHNCYHLTVNALVDLFNAHRDIPYTADQLTDALHGNDSLREFSRVTVDYFIGKALLKKFLVPGGISKDMQSEHLDFSSPQMREDVAALVEIFERLKTNDPVYRSAGLRRGREIMGSPDSVRKLIGKIDKPKEKKNQQ